MSTGTMVSEHGLDFFTPAVEYAFDGQEDIASKLERHPDPEVRSAWRYVRYKRVLLFFLVEVVGVIRCSSIIVCLRPPMASTREGSTCCKSDGLVLARRWVLHT